MNAEKLLSLVDRQLVIDLATEVVETPSPTGEEGDMARLLVRAMKELGCKTTLRATDRGPADQRPLVSAQSSPADDFIAREAVQMAADDQRSAAAATENAKPVVPYRDSPLRPPPRP